MGLDELSDQEMKKVEGGVAHTTELPDDAPADTVGSLTPVTMFLVGKGETTADAAESGILNPNAGN